MLLLFPFTRFALSDPTRKAVGGNQQGQGALTGNSPWNPAMKLGWGRML